MADLLTNTVASVLHLSVDDISDDTCMTECATWDSLNHFNLVLAVEQAFGVRFLSVVIPDLTSIARIRDELHKLKETSA
jgi:acyl carrier protein